jgi:hypothetical protein
MGLTSAFHAHSLFEGAPLNATFERRISDMPNADTRVVSTFVCCTPARYSCFAFSTALAVVSVVAFSSPAPAYESASGPRVRGLGVVVAPVDRRGPTLKPDPLITPDSGWMGSGTAGAAGSGRAPWLPSLVSPPPQPVQVIAPVTPGTGTAKKARKSRGRIIMQKPNG